MKHVLEPWQKDLTDGYRHDVGEGVPPDRRKAERYYRRAARSGEAMAQYYLAQFFNDGTTISDRKKAIAWWTKAAQNGHALAQCNLGVAFEDGLAITKDMRKAKSLYRAAAKQGDAVAQFNLARLQVKSGLHKAAADAFESVVPVLKLLSRKRNGEGLSARVCLAGCAFHGWGMKEDKREAVKWYRSAARRGDVDALTGLGVCYEDGTGVRVNVQKAKLLFATARRVKMRIAQRPLNRADFHLLAKMIQ